MGINLDVAMLYYHYSITIKKSITMKVVYRNVKGGAPKTIKVGYADITISDYCQPETSVIVDEYKGSGNTYEKREQPLLHITLDGEQLFNGTLVQLKELLTTNKNA